MTEQERQAHIIGFINGKPVFSVSGGVDEPLADPDPGNEPPESGNEPPEPGNEPPEPGNEPPEPKSESWRDSIKDEKLRKHAERFTSIESLVSANLTARQKLSEGLRIPGPDADEVEVANFRKALGVPEKAEEYEFPAFAEGEETPELAEQRDKWRSLFHEHNVPKAVAEAIVQEHSKDVEAAITAQRAADAEYAEQSRQELRNEWGADYDTNVSLANNAVAHLFGEDYEDVKHIEGKDGKFVLDDPLFVRAFASIGREMGEGNLGENLLTESQKENYADMADKYRQKAQEAAAAGKDSEAQKWDAKEREMLGKLHGSAPLIGTSGRTA